MNAKLVIGILLIAFGVFALVAQGISYTKHEKVLDVGPIHASAEHKKTVPLPPIIGAFCLAGGIALVVLSPRS